jgi:hypothetical protein
MGERAKEGGRERGSRGEQEKRETLWGGVCEYFGSTTYQGPLCSNHRSQGYDSVTTLFFQYFLFTFNCNLVCMWLELHVLRAREQLYSNKDWWRFQEDSLYFVKRKSNVKWLIRDGR